jgi:hypothetical protein
LARRLSRSSCRRSSLARRLANWTGYHDRIVNSPGQCRIHCMLRQRGLNWQALESPDSLHRAERTCSSPVYDRQGVPLVRHCHRRCLILFAHVLLLALVHHLCWNIRFCRIREPRSATSLDRRLSILISLHSHVLILVVFRPRAWLLRFHRRVHHRRRGAAAHYSLLLHKEMKIQYRIYIRIKIIPRIQSCSAHLPPPALTRRFQPARLEMVHAQLADRSRANLEAHRTIGHQIAMVCLFSL